MDRPRRPGLATLLLSAAALLAAAAPSEAVRIAEDDSVPLVSGNVEPLLTIPGGKPIGARFRDGWMFVTGTEGVTSYDVSDPALPKPAGFLPLPHFENEDVDLGGNVLLVSNDPSEGVGILYVIDISDPGRLLLKGAMANDTIGDGGILAALAPLTGGPVTSPLPPGTGHTVSCVKADCSWAYMAGTADGVVIVDLRDPAAPKVAGRFKPAITGISTHDVQVDETGLAWIVGADGTAAYDVTDPVKPKLVARTDESIVNSGQLGVPGPVTVGLPPEVPFFGGPLFTIGGKGENPIDLIHHDSLRLGSVDKKSGVIKVPKTAGSGKTATPGGDAVRGPSSKAKGVVIAPGATQGGPRKRRAATTRGFKLEPFKQQRGKAYPAGGNSPLLGVVEEDYNRPTCEGAGEFQTWGITKSRTSTGAQKLALLDRHQTELGALVNGRGWAPVTGLCSAHYFDYRDGIVAGGWYEEGTRFLDVRDPANIRQVGYWVPTKGETWSVLFPPTDPKGEIVYALDYARGIDVLRLDRSDLRPREAAVRRSWLAGAHGPKDARTARTGLTQRGRFGFACRAAVAVR